MRFARISGRGDFATFAIFASTLTRTPNAKRIANGAKSHASVRNAAIAICGIGGEHET